MISRIKEICGDNNFQKDLTEFLMAMCEVDTTPNPDVSVMQSREHAVFEMIRNYLSDGGGIFKYDFRGIPDAIENNHAFSQLHFTKTAERPEGLPISEVYKNRGNLLAFLDGEASDTGGDAAVNAHIDVIAPFIPPSREGDKITGRGSVDDKGNVAAICGALKIIEVLAAGGEIQLKNRITAMFPVEEETGGNGSLALALDRELKKRYESMLVMECADNRVYPANRGAVWFRSELTRASSGAVNFNLLEAVAYAVLEMQEEGAAIKSESDHPLFPHRPVQTCNGILGPYGEHPSRINGLIRFRIMDFNSGSIKDIESAVERGVMKFVSRYGDRTTIIDPATGVPKVKRHVDIDRSKADELVIAVHGSTGHMGAILENDDAIVKWACIACELVELRGTGEGPDGGVALRMELSDFDSGMNLVLEGGQGFLPTHNIDDIQRRMALAFEKGVICYSDLLGAGPDSVSCETTYDKLHNDAFDGDPDSTSMRNALLAGEESGFTEPGAPVRGWDVSCDARLFAMEYPDMPVVTSGVGELKSAHSNSESIYLADLWNAVCFCTMYLLRETGSFSRA
ncbi:MAG: M20/M25/M40 family metallo-hydrolase [Spirochaetales bacterium]|jgi:acetylornithine deacetylase/succinyl-diaminopimelate desuccinylase-like protein|nr:M20/M25/M40 family metallo-hydrolase [Spirochaetales bacterium]